MLFRNRKATITLCLAICFCYVLPIFLSQPLDNDNDDLYEENGRANDISADKDLNLVPYEENLDIIIPIQKTLAILNEKNKPNYMKEIVSITIQFSLNELMETRNDEKKQEQLHKLIKEYVNLLKEIVSGKENFNYKNFLNSTELKKLMENKDYTTTVIQGLIMLLQENSPLLNYSTNLFMKKTKAMIEYVKEVYDNTGCRIGNSARGVGQRIANVGRRVKRGLKSAYNKGKNNVVRFQNWLKLRRKSVDKNDRIEPN